MRRRGGGGVGRRSSTAVMGRAYGRRRWPEAVREHLEQRRPRSPAVRAGTVSVTVQRAPLARSGSTCRAACAAVTVRRRLADRRRVPPGRPRCRPAPTRLRRSVDAARCTASSSLPSGLTKLTGGSPAGAARSDGSAAQARGRAVKPAGRRGAVAGGPAGRRGARARRQRAGRGGQRAGARAGPVATRPVAGQHPRLTGGAGPDARSAPVDRCRAAAGRPVGRRGPAAAAGRGPARGGQRAPARARRRARRGPRPRGPGDGGPVRRAAPAAAAATGAPVSGRRAAAGRRPGDRRGQSSARPASPGRPGRPGRAISGRSRRRTSSSGIRRVRVLDHQRGDHVGDRARARGPRHLAVDDLGDRARPGRRARRRAGGPRPPRTAWRPAPTGRRPASPAARRPPPARCRPASPSTRPALVIGASATLRAMPKSVSLTRPSSATSTLPGLTSRWVMPLRCAARSAARRGEADDRGLRHGQRALLADHRGQVARRHQLQHDHGSPLDVDDVEHRDDVRVGQPAERPRLAHDPLAHASSASCAGTPGGTFSSLTATRRCSTSSKPDQTVPIAPLPSSADSR